MKRHTINISYVFLGFLGISFLLILAANLLTPYLSDDFSYGAAVHEARSIPELFRQEARQYMTWNGRSVVHLLLRISLFLPNVFFKLANSACFVLLSLLIYRNAEGHRPYDIGLLVGITLLLWFGSITFSETILWQTGACNYLWGTTIILGFVTLFRERLKNAAASPDASPGRALWSAVGFCLFGLLAGWCNENTSGGGLLLTLGALYFYRSGEPGSPKRALRPWMIAGPAGQLLGLVIMVLSPGARDRAAYQEPEQFSGLVGLFARFQKITLVLQETAFLWIALFVFLFILVMETGKPEARYKLQAMLQNRSMRTALGFGLAALATSYSLVLTAMTQPRAHFGALVFLFVAIAQLFVLVPEQEGLLRAAKRSVLAIGVVFFFFFYMSNMTNLGRIYRECRERTSVIEAQVAAGNTGEVMVAQLRPGFETVLSDAYHVELTEDPAYWTNVAMAQYYGVDGIIALPREEWEALQP
ncbi:MAG: hypothetical protein IJT34_02530 [Butyrivibrio sp.]|nr:hypothetical protein [Butyrivibrio sp.]